MGFKNFLDKSFPFISAALSLGGPAGTMAASLISKAIGVDKLEPTSEAVNTAIANHEDPEILIKLKQVEQDFQLKMEQLGITSVEAFLSLDNSDRADARAREIAIKDKTVRNIAYVVIGTTIILETIVLWHGIPKDLDGVIVGRILGNLDAAMMLVLSYLYGSSAGSDANNRTIADMAKMS